MTLSAPVARKPVHTRQVSCQGFRREDGLWDIEGWLKDSKSYDFDNRDRGGVIAAGEAIHEMAIRITIDDTYVIRKVEAITISAPFTICGEVAPTFAALEGLSLGPGFLRTVRERFAGAAGCTHLVELMAPIATTAFQTLAPLVGAGSENDPRLRMIDSCHALATDGEVVAREWPQFSTRSE